MIEVNGTGPVITSLGFIIAMMLFCLSTLHYLWRSFKEFVLAKQQEKLGDFIVNLTKHDVIASFESIRKVFKNTWLVALGIFWIKYAEILGVLTEKESAGLASSFILSALVIFVCIAVAKASWKIAETVIDGDSGHITPLLTTDDDVIVLQMITFIVLLTMIPVIYSGQPSVMVFIHLCLTGLAWVLLNYLIICATARRFVRFNEWVEHGSH